MQMLRFAQHDSQYLHAFQERVKKSPPLRFYHLFQVTFSSTSSVRHRVPQALQR